MIDVTFNLYSFQIFLFVLAIIWQMVQEFSPPSWAADVLDDDS